MRYLLILLFCLSANATLNDVDKTQIFNKNLLVNGGFENGKAAWTASAGTFAVTSSSPMVGKAHATWDAAASGNTLTGTAITIPPGMYGRNGAVTCLITTASGTATHTVQAWDGTNILVSNTITSSTTPARTSANFIFPSSGTIAPRLYANADEPSIAIDDCFLGPAEGYNVSNISQATFVGSAYYDSTASCTWAVTSATFADFSTAAACPAPTVEFNPGPGTISTADNDLPQFTVSNLPPGTYEVIMRASATTSADVFKTLRISDGTTTSGQQAGYDTNTLIQPMTLVGIFTYTSAGDRTFKLQGTSPSGSVTINVANTSFPRLGFSIKRYPLTSEQAYRPDVVAWRVDANISGANISLGTSAQSAYVTPNNASLTLTQNTGSSSVGISCSSTNDNSVGSTTCSAGSEEPGIVVDIPRAGNVEVCFDFSHYVNHTTLSGDLSSVFEVQRTANGSQTIAENGKSRITSGGSYGAASSFTYINPHSLCGRFNITSAAKHTFRLMYEQGAVTGTSNLILADANTSYGQRDIHVTARYIDQSVPAPLLVGSVTSNSSGVLKEIIANLNCDAGSAITSQTGSTSNGVASIGNVSGGACAVTLASGTFSTTPYCWVTPNAAFASVGLILSAAASSSTAVSVDCEDDASGACTSYDFNLLCKGAP